MPRYDPSILLRAPKYGRSLAQLIELVNQGLAKRLSVGKPHILRSVQRAPP